jgi:photosystem II stability/assembly factor-like uncharacterized protein
MKNCYINYIWCTFLKIHNKNNIIFKILGVVMSKSIYNGISTKGKKINNSVFLTNIYFYFAVLFVWIFSTNISMSNEGTGRVIGGYANEVNVLRASPEDVVYSGTWGDGLYRSNDKGANWTKINSGLTGKYVNYISFGTNGTVIYVSTKDAGLFKSTNGGASFTQINNGLPRINTKVIVSKTIDTLYCGTYGDGIFKSVDGGANWLKSDSGLIYQDVSDICITKSGRIIIGTYGGGIYKSDDNGKTYSRNVGGLVMKYTNKIARVKNDKIVIAGQGNLWESVDNGLNFQQYGVNLDNSLKDVNIVDVVYANATAPSIKEEPVIATRYRGLWYYDSRTYEDWLQANIAGGGVNTITRLSDGTLIAAQPGRGIISSANNGKSWSNLAWWSGDKKIKIISGNNNFFQYIPYATELTKSIDIGKTWSGNLNTANLRITAVDAYGNSVALADESKLIRISNDGGATWTSNGPNLLCVGVAISPADPQIIYAVSPPEPVMPPSTPPVTTFIVKSTNGGTTWTNLGQKVAGLNPKIIASSNGNVYVAVDNFGANKVHKIFVSKDGGTNFTQSVFNPTDDISIQIKDLKVDVNNALYVASTEGLYISNDAGSKFSLNDLNIKSGAYEYPTISTIGIKNPNEIFLGMDSDYGLYRTTNAGTKWDSINNSFNVKTINGMAVNNAGDMLFSTNSIYRITNPLQMGVPTLVAPANNITNVDYNPDIEWNTANKSDLYEMQISDDKFFGYSVETPVIAGTKWKLTKSLQPNTKYYYKVRGKAFASYSEWSQERSFTTKLAQPVLLTPTNTKRGVPTLATLTWAKVNGAEKYNVEVSENINFATILFKKDNTTDTTITTAKLKNLTTYYWRVRAFGKDGNTSDWSVAFEFFTVLPPPVLVSPVNNSEKMPSGSIQFKWKEVPTSEAAYIQVGENDGFETGVFYNGKSEELDAHLLVNFEYNRKYYWRIYASNADGSSDYSEVWNFITTIPGPKLLSPGDKNITIPTKTTLNWNSVLKATRYRVQLSKSANMSNPILDLDSTDQISLETETLDAYETYYWRVKTYVEGVEGEWSEIWSFRTEMSRVVLVEPALGATEQTLNNLFLKWNSVKGATKYDLQLDTKNTFDTASVDYKLIPDWTLLQRDFYNLKENTTYYWSVKPKNGQEEGAWSETWYFITKNETSVEDELGRFVINLYPNPTNSISNLSINLTELAEINYQIYTNAGTMIIEDNLGLMNSGNYNIPIAINNLSNGSYLVNIQLKLSDHSIKNITTKLVVNK